MRAQSGDDQAFADLVAQVACDLRTVLRAERGLCEDVDDVISVALTTLWRRIDQVRVPEAVFGWLVETSRHEAVRQRAIDERRRGAEATFSERIQPLVLDEVSQDDDGSDVQRCLLATVPSRARRMLLWRLGENRGIDEVAARSGCDTRTVRKEISKFRKRLLRLFLCATQESRTDFLGPLSP